MRKVLLCFFLGAVGFTVTAQTTNFSNEVTQAVQEMTALYGLDATQVEKMSVIQERNFNNLAAIAPLKDTNRTAYLEKLAANRKGTDASVRMMLNESQIAIFREQQGQRRITEAKLVKELKAQGLSSEAIRLTVIERTH